MAFKLPTQPTARYKPFGELVITLYGQPKMGKTELAHRFGEGKTLYLATEPGQDFIESYAAPVDSWPQFLEATAALKKAPKGTLPYKAIAVDTIDNLYKFCADATIERINAKGGKSIDHESDLAMGKGYTLVNRAWFDGILELLTFARSAGLGVIFISHARAVIEQGGVEGRVRPGISDSAFMVVSGACDMILYMAPTNGPKPGEAGRILVTKPSPKADAGDRTGLLPPIIQLGTNGEQAIAAFKGAYEKALETKQASPLPPGPPDPPKPPPGRPVG
jgi:hypothetical protein